MKKYIMQKITLMKDKSTQAHNIVKALYQEQNKTVNNNAEYWRLYYKVLEIINE